MDFDGQSPKEELMTLDVLMGMVKEMGLPGNIGDLRGGTGRIRIQKAPVCVYEFLKQWPRNLAGDLRR